VFLEWKPLFLLFFRSFRQDIIIISMTEEVYIQSIAHLAYTVLVASAQIG